VKAISCITPSKQLFHNRKTSNFAGIAILSLREVSRSWCCRVTIFCLLLCGLVPLRGQGQKRNPASHRHISANLKNISNGPLRVVHYARDGSPDILTAVNDRTTAILDAEHLNDPTSARSSAIALAREVQSALFLPSTALFSEVSTRNVGGVWHSEFRLADNGIPVRDGRLSTTIGALTGKVMTVMLSAPIMVPNTTIAQITSQNVFASVPSFLEEDALNPVTSISSPSLVYVRYGGELRLAYEVMVRQENPTYAWRMTVDATTGKLLEKKDMLEYFSGDDGTASVISGKLLATVHPHSPFDSLITVGLPYTKLTVGGKQIVTDSFGNWTVAAANASPDIISTFADAYHHIARHDTASDTLRFALPSPYVILWNDNNSHAAERDAYYASSYARSYMLKLDTGLSAIDSEFTVNVNLNQSCNAFYDADSISLNFFRAGNNCSNSGEIADVVYHEFGHRVAQVRYANGANGNLINYTLGEGFADLVSAFMRDDPRIGIGFFANDSTKVLRTCDNTKSYPFNISADPHVSGEIVSGAIWDLRKLLGHDTAERLFNDMEWLNPDGPDQTSPDVLESVFLQTLVDLLTVDDDDNNLENGTPHSDVILQAFSKHGINLASLIQLAPETIADQDSIATGYAVTTVAEYTGSMGALDPTKLTLIYSTDHGKHVADIPFANLHDSLFVAIIPQVSPGTIVSYYISAGLNLRYGGTQVAPQSFTPMLFTVGYHSVYIDNCEADRGWALRDSSDKATKGLWVRSVPFGTYNIPDDFVQQDTDHTMNGSMCYVTGNQPDPNIDADDVDGGSTTLTTNAIDLTDVTAPVLRYWYYYSNNQGNNPGVPVWETELSGDDGQTWKPVQYTDQSTDGWTSYLIRVSDYVTPSSNVKLRFIASNASGAVVEAGVDDIEALSAPESMDVASSANAGAFGITSIYPNPTTSSPTTIQITLTERTHATLVIKNILGDPVATLTDRSFSPGSYTIAFSPDTYHLESGVYWAILSTPSRQSIRKMIVQ
jgi:hypothetical protein